jgi:hypothetical protein
MDESHEQDNVAPQEEGAANLLLANVDETPGDSTKCNENDVTTETNEFNPFVHICNRLLDAQDTPQKKPNALKSIIAKVSTTGQDVQVYSPSVIAENVVDSEETIQVSSFKFVHLGVAQSSRRPAHSS